MFRQLHFFLWRFFLWLLLLPMIPGGCRYVAGYESVDAGQDTPGEVKRVSARRTGLRLVPVFVQAEGVGTFLHWHDTRLRVDCYFRATESHGWRCVPTGSNSSIQTTGYLRTYADDRCTQPVWPSAVFQWWGDCAIGSSLLTTRSGGSGCFGLDQRIHGDPIIRSFLVTSTPKKGQLYNLWNDRCTPADPTEQEHVSLKEFSLDGLVMGIEERRPTDLPGLEALWMRTEDGAHTREAFFDSTLQELCTFHSLSDGAAPRCLPRGTSSRYGSYLDASCERPVYGHSTSLCPGAPRRISRSFSCPMPMVRLYARGAAETHIARVENAQCVTEERSGLFVRGEPLVLGHLVAAKRVESGSGRLRSIEAAIGAQRHQLTLWDTKHSIPCSFGRSADGQLRCLPRPHVQLFFADPACTKQVAELSVCDGPPPAGMWVTASNGRLVGCVPTRKVYALGAPHPTQLLYGPDKDGACRARRTASAVYELAEEIPPDQFVAGSIQVGSPQL